MFNLLFLIFLGKSIVKILEYKVIPVRRISFNYTHLCYVLKNISGYVEYIYQFHA